MDTKKLFEFLLPAAWRKRPAANPEANDALLGRLSENDPVYRALMDHAYAAFEHCSMSAFEVKLSAEQRAYLCGRAAGLLGYIATVEDTRDRLREAANERGRMAADRARAQKERDDAKSRRARFHVEQSEGPKPS